MELIQQCYSYLFWGVLVALALCVVAVLVYILKAHLTVDRIIGINLSGTLVVIVICALTYLLGEDCLADIAVIYVVVSIIGLYRFDFALQRIHAAALGDTLSLLLFTIGILIAVGFHAVAWKLVLVLVLQWLTSPLSSHMLSMFEYRADENLGQHLDLSDAEYHTEDEEVAAK